MVERRYEQEPCCERRSRSSGKPEQARLRRAAGTVDAAAIADATSAIEVDEWLAYNKAQLGNLRQFSATAADSLEEGAAKKRAKLLEAE